MCSTVIVVYSISVLTLTATTITYLMDDDVSKHRRNQNEKIRTNDIEQNNVKDRGVSVHIESYLRYIL